MIIANVRHILGLTWNIIFVGQFANEGFKATFEKNYCKLVSDEMDMIQGIRKGSMYKLDVEPWVLWEKK